MTYLFWLLVLSTATGLAWFLQRRLRARRLQRQLQAVRLTTEISRQAKVIPPALLSRPIREALAGIFDTTATLLADSPFAGLVDGLNVQSRQFRSIRPAPVAALLPANIRRLFENLERDLAQASDLRLVGTREYALAHSAIRLAMELAGVDILVQEARVALVLKEKDRSEQLKAQALARCARLPAKTAEEVRRRVQATLAA